MDNDNLDDIKKRIQTFFETKIPVHLKLHDGRFLNGLIEEQPSVEFFFLNEFKHGRLLIFITDIYKIESFTAPKEVREC